VITRDQIQAEAVDAIVAERNRVRSTLLQMPTQTGKTRVACKYIRRGIAEWNGRFLVCAHMGELLDQWGRELDAMGIVYRVEKSKQRALDWMRIDPSIRVCLGSKDTLQNRGKSNRLAEWPRDFFTDVLEDEAHLATAKTWDNVHEHFSSAFRLGMTATIDRMDGVPLSTVFESTAYVYPITKAIANGHRVPFQAIQVETDIDIRKVKRTAKGEPDDAALTALIAPKLEPLANVVRQRFESLQGRGVERAIAFLPTVPLAEQFSRFLSAVGVSSKSVHGKDPDRAMKIAEHRQGGFSVLVNQKLLGMGYNDPGIGAVIDMSPTNSRAWLDQKAGRCGATKEGKDCGYLLYAGWECDPDLVGPTDIFAVGENARVAERARAKAKSRMECDPQALVEEARLEIAEEDRCREVADRKLRANVRKRDVRHSYREFDPIGAAKTAGIQVADYAVQEAPDPALLSRLHSLGYQDTRGMSRTLAEATAQLWEDRYQSGMSTFKQFDYLVRRRPKTGHGDDERGSGASDREVTHGEMI
jgi:superfamily II DNA or RNA helicase